MKQILFWGILTCCYSVQAQSLPDNQEAHYDFWVGQWSATWSEGEGLSGKGTNTITKTLDGKVIHEDFKILEGKSRGFKGTSISVFSPQLKQWKQAWADNQGGFIEFTGQIDGNKRIFQTAPKKSPSGGIVTQRMVFYDITMDTFTWDWEASNDEGKTWTLNWRIYYKRLPKATGE